MSLVQTLAYLLRGSSKFGKRNIEQTENEHIKWAKEIFSELDTVNERK